jgi:hypothetical protein
MSASIQFPATRGRSRRFAALACCALIATPAAGAPKRERAAPTADDLMVVDCLLPGALRRLGGNRTFVTPRRPVRTTALDCRIRGGEYTAYDRADYRTALAAWLVEAESGDPEAQYYVGQIYEKGLGQEPDYAKAAEWYEKAAAQGYSPAQNSLGFLYEKGLGVTADAEVALNWYRRSADLPDDVILLEGEEYRDLVSELAARSAEAAEAQRQLAELEQQLAALEDRLDAERAAGRAAQAELVASRERLDAALTAKRRAVASLSQQVATLEAAAGSERAAAPAAPPARPATKTAAAPPPARPPARSALASLDYGPYTALLIANSDYRSMGAIPGAVAEARRLEALMKGKYGFQTRVLENATRYQILSALNELREGLTEKHNLLIFYVGHSAVDQDGQRSWWQPVDAEPQSRVNWISSRVLSDHLDLIPAKHVLVVADASFSGVLTRSSIPKLPSGMSDQKRAELVRGMLGRRTRLALAAAPAAAGGPRPSAFVDSLLDVLEANEGVVEASGVYREVCERLAGHAGAEIPDFAPIRWARSDGGSDFFFVPRKPRS